MRSGEIQLKFGLLALGLLVGFPGLARADVKFTFHTIDVPLCSNTCPRTEPNGNSNNVIVGEFDDDMGSTHGFILRGGVYTQIDFPGAAYTVLNGINEAGQLVGTYRDQATGPNHAFFASGTPGRSCPGAIVGDAGYRFTTLDPPGADRTTGGFINAQSQVVGYYRTSSDHKRHGFLWRSCSFVSPPTPMNAPNDDPNGTLLFGINDPGQIVGDIFDVNFIPHGFFRDTAGNYTPLNAPGAFFTVAQGINNRGEIVGWYEDDNGDHGFVLSGVSGAWTTINVPTAANTYIQSINARGQIVGFYDNHGFVGTPEQ